MKQYVVIFTFKDKSAIGHMFFKAIDKKDAKKQFLEKNISYKEIRKIDIFFNKNKTWDIYE